MPTLREAANLEPLAERVAGALGGRGRAWELLFVDDDSRDGSEAVAAGLAARRPVRMTVRRGGRPDLSRAVLDGIADSRRLHPPAGGPSSASARLACHNAGMLATSDGTPGQRRYGGPDPALVRFRADCRTLADAIAKTGTRLRIALVAETGAEPFLIHASYDIESRMHVYAEAETEAAITRGLEAVGSTCRQFLETAAEAGRRLATPRVPLPVLWDEPALVIGGVAPGTLRRWRQRRLEGTHPGNGTA